MFDSGFTQDEERVRLRLVAAGLPPQSRHAKPLTRAVVTRLGGKVTGPLAEEIDKAVELVKGRAPAAFDPDRHVDPGAAGYREFTARFPKASGRLTQGQESDLASSDEADAQVARLLADLGVRA